MENNNLSRFLIRKIFEKDMSISQFSALIGISRKELHNILHDHNFSSMRILTIDKIAAALDINPIEILDKFPNKASKWEGFDKENDLYIIRTIEFPPEYHSAGISILQNFGKLLRDKYGDTPAKISIVQNNLTVKMIIEPPNGKKIEVEDYLSRYGLVVKGELEPEDLLTDPKQILELKTELRMAQTRLEIQREQTKLISTLYASKITSLEEQIGWLRNQISNGLTNQKNNFTELLLLLSETNKTNQELLGNFISSLVNQDLRELKLTINDLEEKQPNDYSRLKDFISDTLSSAGANAPAWIDLLSKAFPP